MPEFLITNLRGGLNDSDTPASLPDDQVVVAENIDFERSTLGGKRRGTVAINMDGSTLRTEVVFLHRHLPTPDERDAELWAISAFQNQAQINYKDTAWHEVIPVDDVIDVNRGRYRIAAQTLHGKLFFAYPSGLPTSGSGGGSGGGDDLIAVDLLHVWDRGVLRRCGLPQPDSPIVDDDGSGTFATTRYYRVRVTHQVDGVTTRRSEPSESVEFAPAGTGSGAEITRPTLPNEDETHWEVEASLDNANFYRIATLPLATTTHLDTQVAARGYAVDYPLSEDIGDYTRPYSAKYLVADNDRLLMGGSWENPDYASRVSWTPVYTDPGVGNDERIPVDTNNYLDLDTFAGGELTALAGPVNGYVYAFKHGHIYKLVRTGNRVQAYNAVLLSKTRGALPRSIVEGVDEAGNACLYFLDPRTGPSRLGVNGIEDAGADIQRTWRQVDLDARLVCHGVFYPDVRQVWWWVTTIDQE